MEATTNGLEIKVKYQVYELNQIMNSEKHLALERVNFQGFVSNWFDTEQEAIDALVKDGRTYEDFVILKTIRLSN